MQIYFAKFAVEKWWLGGNDQNIEGLYVWGATGQNISLFDWCSRDFQPNDWTGDQDCIGYRIYSGDREWFDEPCHEQKSYICERICNLKLHDFTGQYMNNEC